MISLIVPTLNRSHLLAPLAANVRRTLRSPYTLLFVLDPDDKASHQALRGTRSKWTNCAGTYPQKVNHGVKATTEPFVVLLNDDVKLHAGWHRAAARAFKDGVCVVGPNDLSPATAEGDHATFPIVRRSYLEDPGGVWGEQGTALHEGYHHNFSETELWQLAVDRGVAKFVRRCIIEHRHPDWGKGELDETYERGARTHFQRDQDLFFERLEAWRAS